MRPHLQQPLHELIEQLLTLLDCASTESAVGRCGWAVNMDLMAAYEKLGLKAPHRQCFYLLGLLLSAPSPQHPIAFSDAAWQRACDLLEAIYDLYAQNFEEDSKADDELSLEQRMAVMGYFLHRHTTPRIAGAEQLEERIAITLYPFDADLQRLVGLSASRALEIARWVTGELQADAEMYNDAIRHNRFGIDPKKFAEIRFDWLVDIDWHAEMADPANTTKPIPRDRVGRLYVVRVSDMATRFGDPDAQAFVRLFVSQRGDSPDFRYPTDTNPAERKPIFLLDSNRLFYVPGRFIFNAILDNFTDALMRSDRRQAFLKRRDCALEDQTEACIRRYFGASATVYRNVFELDNREHDLIVLWQDQLLVIEAKARPPIDPSRDPARAFMRLRHAFRDDKGIQKAFEQGRHLRQQLLEGQEVELLDRKGKRLLRLDSDMVKEIHCICLTSEDFGPVAGDLSYLLEKAADDPYPWAVSILELQTVLGGFHHVGRGPDRFFDFLRERAALHGRVLPPDETELAGIFIRYGTLKPLLSVQDDAIVILAPKDGEVFDQIYAEKKGGLKADITRDTPYKLLAVQDSP